MNCHKFYDIIPSKFHSDFFFDAVFVKFIEVLDIAFVIDSHPLGIRSLIKESADGLEVDFDVSDLFKFLNEAILLD